MYNPFQVLGKDSDSQTSLQVDWLNIPPKAVSMIIVVDTMDPSYFQLDI